MLVALPERCYQLFFSNSLLYSESKTKRNTKGQFHARDLFLGEIKSDDDFAKGLLNPRFKSISHA